MSTLAAILIVGLAAAGLTLVVRALVPTLWLLLKPFSCDLCMSWWSSLALYLWQVRALSAAMPVVVLGSVACSVFFLKVVSRLSEVVLTPPQE